MFLKWDKQTKKLRAELASLFRTGIEQHAQEILIFRKRGRPYARYAQSAHEVERLLGEQHGKDGYEFEISFHLRGAEDLIDIYISETIYLFQ